MFRLVLKDFYLFKGMNKLVSLWLLFILFRLNDSTIFAVTTVLAAAMLVRNALILDDKHDVNSLFCSLPLRRSTIVQARYLSSLLIILSVIGLVFLISLFYPQKTMGFKDIFLVFFYLVLFFAVFFPFYYKFGSQLKADSGYIIAAVLILLFLIILLGSVLFIIFKKVDIFKFKFIYVCLVSIMALFVSLSLKFSTGIFKRKEL